ncbi:hypothetical protein PF008_g30760 [Phytophthora fragariae]|uniref:Uncharacterized protein n=1 Tax=Phytophthora fragariae TaxID=53985 RepID=A0A6G0Q4Q4_9STRA|nr:hypothetical protein PF008_g30760 [Phytophthora fragariae]
MVGTPAPIATSAGAPGGSSRVVRRRHRLRLRLRRPPLAARRRHRQRLLLRRSRSEHQRLFRLRRKPVEARVEPFDADAASDCDSGGHPWQIDGDTGSDSCSDDQGRSSSGYSDSGGRQWRLESSRSTQTPPPIATPADASGGSSRAVRRRRRLRLRIRRPPLADRRRHRQRLLLRRSRSEHQRLFRLRRTPVEARIEPFDADAASDCDSGGRQWRLESSRSTQTPPPIATPAATPGRSTETPAATPAPTIKVGAPAAIPTPADASGGSNQAVQRRRRLRLRLRRTPVEARVEPFDADAASDCDSGGHPWQIDGDAGSDSCSDDQGRSTSGYSDSGGRQWRLESSRSTQTPPPIATPADASGGSSRAVRRRRRLRLRIRRPPLADRRRHRQRLLLRRSRSEHQRLFRLRQTPVEARVEPFDADAASDCDSGGRQWRLESSRSTQTPPPIATPAATPGRSTETPAATPAPTIKVGAPAAIPTPTDACGGSSRAVRRRRRLRLRLRRPPLADRRRHRQRLLLRRSRSEQQRLFRLRRTPVEARVEPFDADAAAD